MRLPSKGNLINSLVSAAAMVLSVQTLSGCTLTDSGKLLAGTNRMSDADAKKQFEANKAGFEALQKFLAADPAFTDKVCTLPIKAGQIGNCTANGKDAENWYQVEKPKVIAGSIPTLPKLTPLTKAQVLTNFSVDPGKFDQLCALYKSSGCIAVTKLSGTKDNVSMVLWNRGVVPSEDLAKNPRGTIGITYFQNDQVPWNYTEVPDTAADTTQKRICTKIEPNWFLVYGIEPWVEADPYYQKALKSQSP